MTLRINTNIAAMNAHRSMVKNSNGLTASLEKLSSGLRINKAADDASGMAIADSLRSQGLSLGQAIRNANDGISMVQTADGALEESINIVNTIKTKAVQAAQDGQTTESRQAIQADINKLMEELDIIAKTTSFNNQKLLSGNFTNKKFQIGAYAGETVNISIGSGESTKIGHVAASDFTVTDEVAGTVTLAVYSNVQDKVFNINELSLAYDNTRENSMGAVADALNKLSDVLGITAKASVTTTTAAAIAAGTTEAFVINDVTMGAVTVKANDADGALVAAINSKTDQHGVYASVDYTGKLTLTSLDNRAIEVAETGGVVLGAVAANLSTFGKIALTQNGTSDIAITNSGTAVTATSATTSYRLSDIDVTDQEGAQIAIAVADSALKSLDKVRSDLGSVQNQLSSTIANITVTRVNIFAAESTIRDADFADEASNFTKMQILAQAGAFALAQANASSQNVLSLLQ